MKTKYGEINSIRDFFEATGEEKITNPEADQHLRVILMKVKCKICGDIFEIQSEEGAMHFGGYGNTGQLKEHIELHKIVEVLK